MQHTTHFDPKNQKNHNLTFSQQKTRNKHYHSNQSPILNFSPSNCLHFLNILPSADINCFWATKPFIQPYPNFTMSAMLVFGCKNMLNQSFVLLTPCASTTTQKWMKKQNMTEIKQIEHFQTCIHTFCLLMPTGDFHHHTLYNVWFKSPKNHLLASKGGYPNPNPKYSCPMYGGPKTKVWKKWKNILFLNDFYHFFFTFWTLLESSSIKRMLRGRFWCLVCVNQTIHFWVMAVWLWFLGYRLLEAQNVLSTISGCKINSIVSMHRCLKDIGGRWCA